jgi:glycosyltransferase involved in cell wall biosynthesis
MYKKKILIISSSVNSIGGAETYILTLQKIFISLDYEVSILLSSASHMDILASKLREHSQVYRIFYRSTFKRGLRSLGAVLDWRGIFRLVSFYKSIDIEVCLLNMHCAEDALDHAKALELARKKVIKMVHIGLSMRQQNGRFSGIRDWLARKQLGVGCQTIIVPSSGARDRLASWGNILPPMRIEVVHNAIIPVNFLPRDVVRKQFGFNEADFVLSFLGRIDHQKRLDFLIGILTRLDSRFKLLLIGDGDERESLQYSANRNYLSARVIITGWLDGGASLLSGADLFCLPSKWEGLPLAGIEALNAGLPILATNFDGASELIENGINGWIIDELSMDKWVACIEEFAKKEENILKFRDASKNRFNNFTISLATNTMKNILP